MTTLATRERLLDPNKRSDVRIEAYALHLGTIQKGSGPRNVLRANPPVIFRPTRILVAARIVVVYPLWMRLLSWIVLPWLFFDVQDSDPDESWWRRLLHRELWSFQWWRPVRHAMNGHAAQKQQEALASCALVSLKVANVETFMPEGAMPLAMFYYGLSPDLLMPTATPQFGITAEFSGTPTCTFDVSLSGFAGVSGFAGAVTGAS